MLVGCRSELNRCAAYGASRWNVDDNFFFGKTRFQTVECWDQVGIAAYDDETVGKVLVGVVEQVDRDVNVSSFFFRGGEETIPRMRTLSNATLDLFGLESAEYDLDERERLEGL